MKRAQPKDVVTMGHLRAHGCRDLLVYCTSIWCNHSTKLNVDWLPDDAEPQGLAPRMVCTDCGLIGADVRPDWSPLAGGGMGGAHLRGRST
jgi:hypothetical protein